MTTDRASVEGALAHVAKELRRRGIPFALVGGLGVSIRGEVRFTRDVDVVVVVDRDEDTERLARDLSAAGYTILAVVENETRGRLAIAKLRSPNGVVVALLAASSGIEREVVERATPISIDGVGTVPVGRAEELLALKVLSMTDRRLQDRIDADALLAVNPDLDLDVVRHHLRAMRERGYDRNQDLLAKLDGLLRAREG